MLTPGQVTTVGSIRAQRRDPSPGLSHPRRSPSRLRDACYDFEAVFLAALMKQMRRPAFPGGLLSPGLAERAFREQLDFELAREMARRGDVGIADMLYQQISDALPASETPGQAGQEASDDDEISGSRDVGRG